ncbi:HTH-type transcriptional regulator BetI [Sinobacterium norvegicum]|uniref:HTH-type transcriptional regulator BetI n=1 Tax=Sinobacterium norvegicum TaxID=1641715 RepID=A0ABM9AI88_9GAMM|nr:TetR family transcriptional regulator [Sinobacterium norvegicum]CAH0992469.1 HTH-type transcriptional regulator BetI [Sinobacterium norvegicum]
MARKSKHEAEKTRQALLDSALQMFGELGLVKTTLSQIAKNAGVTRGAIYWHFDDKADLMMALWQAEFSGFNIIAAEMASLTGKELRQALLQSCQEFCQQCFSNPRLQQVVKLSLQVYADEDCMKIFADCRQQDIDSLQAVMDLLFAEQQLLPHLNAESATWVLNAMIAGFCHQWVVVDEDKQIAGQLPALMRSLECSLFNTA